MIYELRRSARARALRLAVYPDGRVVLTAPERATAGAIERFARKNSAWVGRALARTRAKSVIRLRRADIPRLKRDAAALASERGRHFAGLYGVGIGNIAIRAQRSRWGSCSHRGNLSFNYRIAALPAHLADYIVVHEICHLRELNHSRAFWSLVERTLPHHKALRKELRDIAFVFS